MNLVEVRNNRQIRQFITFPEKLYKDCPNWVAPLRFDERNVLSPKNPAFEFCEAVYYLVVNEKNEILGRIAGIINHRANKDWEEKTARFGWIDFIEDIDVLRLLIDGVTNWAKEKGMKYLKGPLGFTDMDKEGMLVEGFEHLAPITCIYNYPYYGAMLEQLGFHKDVDWTQRLLMVPEKTPPIFEYADLVTKRFGVKLFEPKSNKELKSKGRQLFEVLNNSFAPLYEFTKLTDRQIDCYLDEYLPFVDKDYTCMALNERDEVVGFIICIPDLSQAFKKANGKIFPLGFAHILHDLRHCTTLEALMIGTLPEYQGKGASLLLLKHVIESCHRHKITTVRMNPQLEENNKVQSLFDQFEVKPFLRRRSYTITL